MVKTATVNKVSNKKMAIAEAAYMAGFLDGEGTITVVKTAHKRTRAGFQYQACLSLANTYRAVLEHVVGLCGNGRIIVTSRPHATHKLGYAIRFSANQIRHVLPQLLPYLLVKKQQADLVLEFLSIRTIGKHLSNVEYQRAEDIRAALQELNRRGTAADVRQREWDAIRPTRLGNNQWTKTAS